MRIILIYPLTGVDAIKLPPLGLLYLASQLLKEKHEVKVIDANANGLSNEQILKRVKSYKPDLIGLPIYSQLRKCIHPLIQLLSKEARIVAGGPHPSICPEETLEEFTNIEYILRGEGEFSLANLVRCLECQDDIRQVKSLSYRDKGKIIHNQDAEIIRNLDMLEFPARHLIEEEFRTNKYYSVAIKRMPIDMIYTSRGCPSNCGFCYKMSKNYRQRSIDNVLKEIDYLSAKGVKTMEIMDDNFTLNRKRFLEIMNKIAERKYNISFRLKSRVEDVDEELLMTAKRAGVYGISYGMESGSPRILELMNKMTTIEMSERACKLTKKAGMKVFSSWVIGYPGETRDTLEETINYIKKIKPTIVIINTLVPYPGTAIYRLAKEKGWLVGEWKNSECEPWIKLPWTETYNDLLMATSYVERSVLLDLQILFNNIMEIFRNISWRLIKFIILKSFGILKDIFVRSPRVQY